MKRKSIEWWIGQVVAIFLGIAALGATNSWFLLSLVTYALVVLVDIRENTTPKD